MSSYTKYSKSLINRRRSTRAINKRLKAMHPIPSDDKTNLEPSDIYNQAYDFCCVNNNTQNNEGCSNNIKGDANAKNVSSRPSIESEPTTSCNDNDFHFLNEEVVFDELSSNSDTDDESSGAFKFDLASALSDWAVQYSITLTALSALLCILRLVDPSLPKDARTILKTPRNFKVERRAGGDFFHFGVVGALTSIFNEIYERLADKSVLNLQLNIDGLPLFKSSGTSFWPVLGLLQGFDLKTPVLISIFCGNAKPNNLAEYFGDLVAELKTLYNGFTFRDKTFLLRICSIVCDAPARAFVKAIKGHTAYSGCDKCTQVGEYISNRMTFPLNNAPLRTDDSYSLFTDEEHHLKNKENLLIKSPFLDLNIGMVSQFPHDYMHLICLGVVRRLINLWLSGPLTCRLSSLTAEKLSLTLLKLRKFIPVEFARKPRSLKDINRWKATEFRLFLFYTGPVCLHNVVATEIYNNFLLLFVAMFCLASPKYRSNYNSYAQQLITLFVNHFSMLYGKEQIVYNVHNVIHLADDVKRHGIIDDISGFPYENYLQQLKRLVRKPQYPLSQIIRRLSEKNMVKKNHVSNKNLTCKKKHIKGPDPTNFGTLKHQFEEMYLNGFCIKLSVGNNCVMVKGELGLVKNILLIDGSAYIVYQAFAKKSNFFTYPVDSKSFGIFLVSGLDNVVRFSAVDESVQKYVLLPSDDGFVAIPLLHLNM